MCISSTFLAFRFTVIIAGYFSIISWGACSQTPSRSMLVKVGTLFRSWIRFLYYMLLYSYLPLFISHYQKYPSLNKFLKEILHVHIYTHASTHCIASYMQKARTSNHNMWSPYLKFHHLHSPYEWNPQLHAQIGHHAHQQLKFNFHIL